MLSSVWRHSTRWFVTGLLVGSMVAGIMLIPPALLVGLVVSDGVRLWLAAILVLPLLGADLIGWGGKLPQNRRVVPQSLQIAGRISGPFQFGFEMGTGVRTFVPTALPLALVLAVIAWSPGAGTCLLAAAGFGAGRAVLVPVRSVRPELWDDRLATAKRLFSLPLVAGFGACFGVMVATGTTGS